MWNIVHYIIGFCSELGLISPEGALAIDKELSPQIISSNAREAFDQVHKAMEQVSKDLKLKGNLAKIEPWVKEIQILEKRVKELEAKLDLVAKSQIKAVQTSPKKPIAKSKA